MMKVCVLGLGQIGLPVSTYAAGRGIETWGYDISPFAVERAKENNLPATSNWNEIPPVDIYLVCVTTALRSGLPDLSSLFNVSRLIKKVAHSNSVVSVESTVMPGASRKIFKTIFRESVHLVHVPHRYWPGDPANFGVNQPRIIGGVDKESLDEGIRFYHDSLGIPIRAVSPIEIAEMTKIAENAYRYITIAFAEELKMICDRLDLDFEEVRESCNTKWNVKIPEARDGIGGHCLPKDTRYLTSLTSRNIILKGALRADEEYRKFVASEHRKQKSKRTLELPTKLGATGG